MTFKCMFGYEEKCYSFIDSEQDYLIDVVGKAVKCLENDIEEDREV